MIVQKTHNGILIYESVDLFLFQRLYIDYTEKQAIKKFKKELKLKKHEHSKKN